MNRAKIEIGSLLRDRESRYITERQIVADFCTKVNSRLKRKNSYQSELLLSPSLEDCTIFHFRLFLKNCSISFQGNMVLTILLVFSTSPTPHAEGKKLPKQPVVQYKLKIKIKMKNSCKKKIWINILFELQRC